MIADVDNCAVYYVCNDNQATQQECADGSYFNGSGCVPGTCPDSTTSSTTTSTTSTTTTTTTSAPGCDCDDGTINGQLVADKNNCRKYFICDNGVLVPGDCLKGNFFNSSLAVCQPDTENVCPDSSAPDCDCDGQKIEDAENCNKFYICQNGDWLSETCPNGEYFDVASANCVPDTDNVCPQCDAGNGANTETSTTEKPDDSHESYECIESDKAYVADNCWSYYACISGKWQKESCAIDSYFDTTLAICRQDENNQNCPENKSTKKKHVKGSRDKRSVEPSETCCEGTMEPHPSDCDKYLICVNEDWIEGSCGQGNIFSSSQGVCMPDIDETCWLCRTRPNGFKLPNPDDCTSYLTCSNGLATAHQCSDGEWYNGASCEIDVSAKCINPCNCSATATNAAHPICTKYYECNDGTATVVNCPAGEGFDSSSGVCSSSADCPAINCATAENGITYPVAGDNTKFYVCIGQKPLIESCPQNYEFIEALGICLSAPSVGLNLCRFQP